ncbi:hypothetical protein PhCBS80983_g01359 [Powellomyces hirtus]|uniref:Transcription factor CBF/NF-Y/archaeal histone domain-containing protein n=1 Tax=Powellomyces hirtus TaxID=109895 RepID=A0A507ED11_9FUNG|nr:hypothetical protein PhCBS80983_g01359 [Powellomyces hirtus]
MNKRYKTKFPVARIKKIMRTDDDVGKVAQVTPVLISKALELFMAALIEETCKESRSRMSKKMTTAHLKRTILEVDTFDFLAPLVENLPDPVVTGGPEGGDGSAGSSGAPTKGKGGRGRGGAAARDEPAVKEERIKKEHDYGV